jgi:hypothetical protein
MRGLVFVLRRLVVRWQLHCLNRQEQDIVDARQQALDCLLQVRRKQLAKKELLGLERFVIARPGH